MSYMYYPYVFDSDIYKANEEDLEVADTEINKAINYAFDLFEEPTEVEDPIVYNQSMDLEAWLKAAIC